MLMGRALHLYAELRHVGDLLAYTLKALLFDIFLCDGHDQGLT